MVESEIAERVAARRAELDELEDQLVKQVRAERDELAVAERVWKRMAEQFAAEQAVAAPASAQVAGHAVLLVPHRGPGVGVDALPPDYQRILAIVRGAGGPVATKQVGEELGLEVAVRGKLEPSPSSASRGYPMRRKLSKLAGRAGCASCPTASSPRACDLPRCDV